MARQPGTPIPALDTPVRRPAEPHGAAGAVRCRAVTGRRGRGVRAGAVGLALLAAGGGVEAWAGWWPRPPWAPAPWPGASVQGRPIVAVQRGDPDAATAVLVVGVIHGNETAGLAVTRRLRRMAVPRGVRLWLVDRINPDGLAAHTRQNARGVDLNRNFPFRWRRQASRANGQYPGATPLSEPESRAAVRLITRVRPRVTIWFHQRFGPAVVDLSGGDARVERRYARLAGLPVERLERYPGSATGWQNHRFRGTTAFVVELRAGAPPPPGAVTRLARAVLELARSRRSR
jgi:protein MpaA